MILRPIQWESGANIRYHKRLPVESSLPVISPDTARVDGRGKMGSTENSSTPTISTAGLTKKYGEFCAVRDLTLDVRRGEIVAFLGPNGAGKTTTIRMLMGILQPTSGEAAIGGLDCFRERVAVKRLVGYLPDEPIFYDYLKGGELLDFVGEMHGFSREAGRRRWEPLVERLELHDALGEYAVNYSRGMKKKLALACALLHDPLVLILDEPTNGLDPYATRSLHQVIVEKAEEGKTVFFSTHLLEQAEKLCHRSAIICKSELAAVGTLAELRGLATENSSLEEIFFALTHPGSD